jgi:CHAT domain-containing protein/tetratricopeptide (TPR) repeat protein
MSSEAPSTDKDALGEFERGKDLLFGQPPQPDLAIEPLERARSFWSRCSAAASANLATAFLNRREGQHLENHDRAISLFEEALAANLLVLDQDVPNVLNILYLLAHAYVARGGPDHEASIDRALELLGVGLNLANEQGADGGMRAQFFVGAAEALTSQLADGRVENQERSIELLNEAIRLATAAGAENIVSIAHHQLGSAYLTRARGSPIVNRAFAISNLTAAASAVDPASAPADAVRSSVVLAQAHAGQGGPQSPQQASEAIETSRRAVEMAKEHGTSRDTVIALYALGEALASDVGPDREARWPQAHDTYRRAIALAATGVAEPADRPTIQNALGYELARRSRADSAAFTEGVELLRNSAATFHSLHDDDKVVLSSRNLGYELQRAERFREARDAFEDALAASQRLVAVAWTDVGRRTETAQVSRVAPESAYCSLRLGDHARALATLESGRATMLSAQMRLDDVRSADLPQPLATRLAACRRDVEHLEAAAQAEPGGPEPFANMRGLLDAQRNLAAVRAEVAMVIPRVEQRGLTVAELLAEVPAGGALVVPMATTMGGACFIIPDGRDTVTGDDVVLLPDLTTAEVTSLWAGDRTRVGWRQAYRSALEVRSDTNLDCWYRVMSSCLERLWTLLMAPVDERLRALGLVSGATIVVMPQGGLGVFPLHAAAPPNQNSQDAFLDHWTVRSAPSGEVLRSTRTRQTPSNLRLAAVADPTVELPAADAEVEAIKMHFAVSECSVLAGSAATRAAVENAFHDRTHIHIASHAIYGWDDPTRSRLSLHNGESLDLGRVTFELDLNGTRLVVLSACETGITEVDTSPDEYIGLAGAFLAAGAQAVVSALWAVNDLPTALLLTRFYDIHLGRNIAPAESLANAQRWLRDATARELLAVGPWSRSHLPEGRARALWQGLVEYAERDGMSKPFAHPVYWAAFAVTGS